MREKPKPFELTDKARIAQEADIGMAIENAEQEIADVLADIRLAKTNKAQWELDIEHDLQSEMAMLSLLDETDPTDSERADEVRTNGKSFRELLGESIGRIDELIMRLQSKQEQAWRRREQLIEARRSLVQAWDALDRERAQKGQGIA